MSDLVLRDYQAAAIEALRQGFRDEHYRQVLVSATGSGKSRTMEAMIRAALDKGSRVMFMCERRVLVEQFSQHLDNARIPHGVLMAKHWRYRPYEKVQVVSAQTLERMKEVPETDILFIDEVHACMRESVIKLIDARPKMRVVGATATPFNPVLGKYFTNHTNARTMSQLVEEKHLVPFRVFVATEIDTEGLKTVAGEWKKDDLEKRGQQIVGDVVADYVRITHELYGGPVKTICFSCGIAHGADLVTQFQAVGINAVQISSNDDDEYKAEVLRDFAKADTEIKVVISVAILSRGFDQADVQHVILARPLKKSFSEHVQMVGRGARIHHSKAFCSVQDNSGNWLRFLEDWNQLFFEGVDKLANGKDEKPRKEPSKEQKEAAKCGKCGCVMPPSTDTCPSCGHVRAKRSEVVAVPGEMKELDAGNGGSRAEKQAWWSAFQYMANARGKSPSWCLAMYKQKFNVWPKGLSDTPAPPTMEMTKWEHSRRIAWAKSKKRNAA